MHYIMVEEEKVEVTESGRLIDASRWTEEVARGLAKTRGIAELTEEHFMVINCFRSNNGASSDMYQVMESLRKMIPDWPRFKQRFPGGLTQACVISSCTEP